VLHVRDDGMGFPAGLDFRETESFGLQLACLLTEQLGGTLDMASGPGTHWKLTLPVASAQAHGEEDGPAQIFSIEESGPIGWLKSTFFVPCGPVKPGTFSGSKSHQAVRHAEEDLPEEG